MLQTAPPKARLAEVLDLQLLLPEMQGSEMTMEVASAPAPELSSAAGRPDQAVGSWALPAGGPSTLAASPPGRQQSPHRPVIRGLIADVIEEMSVPAYEPAEVSGGRELGALFAPQRSSLAVSVSAQLGRRRAGAAPLDEDALGRRLGVPPPAYEVGPPPPYEGPTPPTRAEEAELRRLHAEKLKAQEQAVAAAQAAAKDQVQQLLEAQALLQTQAQAHRDEALELVRSMQRQAAEAQQRLAEAAERQAAALQSAAADLQERLAEAAIRELGRRDEGGLSRGAPGPEAARPEITHLLASMQDSVRRVEVQLERQMLESTRGLAAQSEERAAYLASLSDMNRGPMQVVPMSMQQPAPVAPPPAPPPPPETAKVPAQAMLDAVAQTVTDHRLREATVARFKDYLLRGPPGERPPPEGLSLPRYAWPQVVGEEALLVISLPASPPATSSYFYSEEASSPPPGRFSSELLLSPGEVLLPAWRGPLRIALSPGEDLSTGEAWPTEAAPESPMSSRTVVSLAPPAASSPLGGSPIRGDGRHTGLGDSPGELDGFAGPGSDGEVSSGEAGPCQDNSIGVPSSGEVSASLSPEAPR